MGASDIGGIEIVLTLLVEVITLYLRFAIIEV